MALQATRPTHFCAEVSEGDGVLIFKNRNFSLLWWGGLVSLLGNWMLIVALPVYVYRETGSTVATSLMFIAGTVPRVLLGSFVGVWVDRLEHKRTMFVCNLLLAGTLLPLLVLGQGVLWPVYAVALCQAVIGLFFGPAENAFLPTLVGRNDLITANALNALNNNLARLIGPAVGGLIVSYFGLVGVVVFDLASYLVAATLIRLITLPDEEKLGQTQNTRSSPMRLPSRLSWRAGWLEGLAQIRQSRIITVVLYALTLAAFGEGSFSVLFAPFITEAFAGNTLQFGWVMSAQAVGGILGGLLIGWLRQLEPARLFAFGLIFLGIIDLVMFNYAASVAALGPVIVGMVIVGVPATAIGAGYTTLLQTHAGDAFLGRVFSMIDALSALALLAGMVFAGLLGELIGVVTLMKVQGIAHTLAGLFVLICLNPHSGSREER